MLQRVGVLVVVLALHLLVLSVLWRALHTQLPWYQNQNTAQGPRLTPIVLRLAPLAAATPAQHRAPKPQARGRPPPSPANPLAAPPPGVAVPLPPSPTTTTATATTAANPSAPASAPLRLDAQTIQQAAAQAAHGLAGNATQLAAQGPAINPQRQSQMANAIRSTAQPHDLADLVRNMTEQGLEGVRQEGCKDSRPHYAGQAIGGGVNFPFALNNKNNCEPK